MNEHPPLLLSLPAELRNHIYEYIFGTANDSSVTIPSSFAASSSVAVPNAQPHPLYLNNLSILLTCRTIYHEASPLAFSSTTFRLRSACPISVSARLSTLRPALVTSLRHLTICAKTTALLDISSWCLYPFGNEALRLETLTIVPRRPRTFDSSHRRAAYLFKCHRLALFLGRCLVNLENVSHFRLVNNGCFEGGLSGFWGEFCRSILEMMKGERVLIGYTEKRWRWDTSDDMFELMRVNGKQIDTDTERKARNHAWGWDEDFF